MNKLILHIPHSSTHIPFTEGYNSNELIEREVFKLTDWFTDELFYSKKDHSIIASFSRVFCDVERFSEDAQEVMAQYGMGVLYNKTDDGQTLRSLTSPLKVKILTSYYWPHHEKLNSAVANCLKSDGKALIVDCHSFSDTPFIRDLNQDANRPDFNIGTNPYHTSQLLIDHSIDFFESKGVSLGIDWPYSGTIVPLKYYGVNQNVQSIMLEINRKLYLNEQTNEKSERFHEIQKTTKEYLDSIRKLINV